MFYRCDEVVANQTGKSVPHSALSGFAVATAVFYYVFITINILRYLLGDMLRRAVAIIQVSDNDAVCGFEHVIQFLLDIMALGRVKIRRQTS